MTALIDRLGRALTAGMGQETVLLAGDHVDLPRASDGSLKPAAVLVSAGDYERLVRRNSSFSEFMRRSPLYQSEMELVRDKTAAREVEL